MEIETVARMKLPITWIIINNNGIGGGVGPEAFESLQKAGTLPVGALMPETRYDMVSAWNRIIRYFQDLTPCYFVQFADAVGGKGYICRTPAEIRTALTEALTLKKLTIINVLISPSGGRKAQSFAWLERKESKM
jgi:2-hydroxyacyl-CoA lyase 1